jgi:hypothetical protein
MNSDFRSIVHAAAFRHCRGHITYCTTKTCKTRGGRYWSEFTHHELKDAILRRVGKKSWDITSPDGYTFRKQEDSKLFRFLNVRPITERSYRILLKKRTAHPATTV